MAMEAVDDAIRLLDSIIARLRDPPRTISERPLHVQDEAISDKKQFAASSLQKPPSVPSPAPPPQASVVIEDGKESSEDFDKAHLEVGRVISVDDHPVADKLYVCKVEISNGEFKQVVAGLRKFLSPEGLLEKKVCLVRNLKPAKLAGQLSEAMILAGETSDISGALTVKILEPPIDASIGDRIYLEGSVPSAKPPKQLSSKIWEKIVPLLSIQGGVAKFGSRSLVTSSGLVTGPGLPDGANIH